MTGISGFSNPVQNHLPALASQSGVRGTDADGDTDGSKAGQANNNAQSLKLATSGNLGTRVNTAA